MIYLILLIVTILLFLFSLWAIFDKSLEEENYAYRLMGACLTTFTSFLFLLNSIFFCSKDLSEANRLNAEIKMMQPASINIAKLKRTEAEYKAISKHIQEAFNKHEIQANTTDIAGMSVYVAPFSAGVGSFNGIGDIERGAGEKLKNLEALINKQWKLAEDLVALEVQTYKPEFYELNQKLHVIKYNLFSGLIVRALIRDIKPVYNDDYYASGVSVDKEKV